MARQVPDTRVEVSLGLASQSTGVVLRGGSFSIRKTPVKKPLMPVLSNPKHERFAQELAKGIGISQAYVTAGYSKNDGNASRLNGNEKIQARVRELLEIGAEKAGVTVQRIVDELAKIAFATASDYFTWGPDGVQVKPSGDLTPEQLAVVSEVQETRAKGHGETTIKVKLSDKQSALEKLGRHLGMFKDRMEHSGPDGKPLPQEKTVVILPANGR